jgi:tetratricopeptide (TPR) repeat protein
MQAGLAEAWWSRVCDQAEEGEERRAALYTLAVNRTAEGKYVEAELNYRELLGAERRMLGEEHPSTLATSSGLAESLLNQGKHAQAERIYRKVLGVQRRVLGMEHPGTLASASSLASVLLHGDAGLAEAERILREVLGVQRRVLGEEDLSTMASAYNLAASLSDQGKHAEAEQIQRELHGVARRVLGEEHPKTLMSAIKSGNVALGEREGRRLGGGADLPRRAGCEETGTGSGPSTHAAVCEPSGNVHFDARKARRGGADLPGDD